MKTRFNFVSKSGDGMGVAMRILDEGEDARIFIEDQDARAIGDGLVPKVGLIYDLLEDVDSGQDVFVFDSSGQGLLADYLRSQNLSVIGASAIADRLEHNRDFGTAVMEDAGIKIPKSTPFTSFEEGVEFARKSKTRLVFKPEKQLGETAMSHVSYDQEDMIELLSNLKDEVKIEKPEFVLQEFIEGTAISSEAWFDGRQFLPLFNHTLERKELMDGNLGPSGGCTGNVVWPCGECLICEKGIRRMEKFLRKEQYVGMLDLNAIVTEDGEVYGLEWTPRFGYDATPTLLFKSLDGSVSRFLSDIARGQYDKFNSPGLRSETYASALRMTIPPWPSEKFQAEADVPLGGLEPSDLRDTYLYNVKASQRTEGSRRLVSAGAWGIICLFLGLGTSVARSFSRPYQLAEQLRLPDKQYRLDLRKQFESDLVKLGVSVEQEA